MGEIVAAPRDSTRASTGSEGGMVGPVDVVKPTHLSPTVEAAIRLLPGNDRCADCKAIYPQWSGVSFGILLCLGCAGKHRSLGVHVSFVKSLAMDSWSPTEQRCIEIGGNAKWMAVCAATSTSDLPLAEKYKSSIAHAYKNRIVQVATNPAESQLLTATEFLATLCSTITLPESGTAIPHQQSSTSAEILRLFILEESVMHRQPPSMGDSSDIHQSNDTGMSLSVKCTTCNSSIPLDQLDSHSKKCTVSASTAVVWRKYERKLGRPDEPLGFSLTKTKGGYAEVTRLTPGGEAERSKVLVGSYVVGLGDTKTSLFEEIVEHVKTMPRPLVFHFVYRSNMEAAKPVPSISSVPEPVSIVTEVTFYDQELGCSIIAQEFRCVVINVAKDGIAKKHGVLVGSRVVEVNGQKYLKPADLLMEIQKNQRPIRVKFHRVEGLMRGWNK